MGETFVLVDKDDLNCVVRTFGSLAEMKDFAKLNRLVIFRSRLSHFTYFVIGVKSGH